MNFPALRVLVTGATGQLGQALQASVPRFAQVLALGREGLDITNPQRVAEVISEFKPHLILNAAAYNAVDLAQKEPQQAYAVNADGVKYIARQAAMINCPVIHISTDYVFDGVLQKAQNPQRPYTEADIPHPVNVYGLSKLAGEEALQQHNSQCMVIRTSSVFGGVKSNFVQRILQLAQEKNELQVVDDQISCPTPVSALAQALWMLVERYALNHELPWGIWHFVGAPACSRYEWACQIIHLAQGMGIVNDIVRVCAVKAMMHGAFSAQRPSYSVLDCRKWALEFGEVVPIPDWRKELEVYLTRLT